MVAITKMSKKRTSLLKKVAEKTGYTYGYVKNVSCGYRKNQKVLSAIIAERQNELDKLAATR